jgi:glycosyltransferase involved in cell wall biosynthesis
VTCSIVVPVYGNEDSIDALIEGLTGIDQQLDATLEVVFVVDGSPDRSHDLLASKLPHTSFQSVLILLSRNFGAFAAVREGMRVASGDHIGVMAADLQEPPELMLQFFDILRSGSADITVGVREGRSDPLVSRALSRVFWSLYRKLVMPEMPRGGVDVFACTAEIRDHLLALNESRSSLVAQLFWLGHRRVEVPYERRRRHSGKSGWSLRKRINYLTDSVFSFTDLPIRMLTLTGLTGVVASVIVGTITVVGRLVNWFSVPGYTATIGLLLFFGSLNLLGLGIVGSYAWRAFENTKARPMAIPMATRHFPPKDHT